MLDVGATSSSPPAGLDPRALDALAVEAWMLEPLAPHERSSLVRDEAAALLDGLLVKVARGQGALEVALGEALRALSVGDRLLQLGYVSVGDYARERLGIGASTARTMAKLAEALRSRPLLREAVRTGTVSARKALAVLPRAVGAGEAAWTARARTETVRALEAAVLAEGAEAGAREEAWDRVQLELEPSARAALDEALALAGQVLGPAAPRHARYEAICQEFISAFPGAAPDPARERSAGEPALGGWREAARAALEAEARGWEFLPAVAPVAAPPDAAADAEGEADPAGALDAECRRLAGLRRRWDELLGHLAMLVRDLGLWREMLFADFAHYVAERLGMAPSTVNQRIWLERRLHELPALRGAMRDGRLSYEQARLVAREATAEDVGARISDAAGKTCVALRREQEASRERQLCARRALDVRLPRDVAVLLAAAIHAARAASDTLLTPSQCLERIARHFVEVWTPEVKPRRTLHRRVIERDRWCQVPGCSRPAMHAHHLRHRSLGGPDHLANLSGLCIAHHLAAVHGGHLRVTGVAPDALVWVLTRTGAPWLPAPPPV